MPSHDAGPALADDAETYQAIHPSAVIGLLLGLASPLALLHPLLWVVPLLAAVVSIYALRQIAYYAPVYTGRMPALLGLGLSIALGVAAFTQHQLIVWTLDYESRRFGSAWLELLRQDDILVAHQLTMIASTRYPLDENLLAIYRDDGRQRAGLQMFVDEPAVRTLLALGTDATIRFYQTEDVQRAGRSAVVVQSYAVSYLDGSDLKTFFVRLLLRRNYDPDTASFHWQVQTIDGGIRPVALGGP